MDELLIIIRKRNILSIRFPYDIRHVKLAAPEL